MSAGLIVSSGASSTMRHVLIAAKLRMRGVVFCGKQEARTMEGGPARCNLGRDHS